MHDYAVCNTILCQPIVYYKFPWLPLTLILGHDKPIVYINISANSYESGIYDLNQMKQINSATHAILIEKYERQILHIM